MQTVPRDAAQQVLNFLTDSYFQECPTGNVHYSSTYANYVGANNESLEVKFRDVADGTFSAISCLPTSLSSRLPDGDSYSRIFKNDTEPDDDRKFASISLDSGFMSDSKDNEDLGLD